VGERTKGEERVGRGKERRERGGMGRIREG